MHEIRQSDMCRNTSSMLRIYSLAVSLGRFVSLCAKSIAILLWICVFGAKQCSRARTYIDKCTARTHTMAISLFVQRFISGWFCCITLSRAKVDWQREAQNYRPCERQTICNFSIHNLCARACFFRLLAGGTHTYFRGLLIFVVAAAAVAFRIFIENQRLFIYVKWQKESLCMCVHVNEIAC